jgi:hypothetical protein
LYVQLEAHRFPQSMLWRGCRAEQQTWTLHPSVPSPTIWVPQCVGRQCPKCPIPQSPYYGLWGIGHLFVQGWAFEVQYPLGDPKVPRRLHPSVQSARSAEDVDGTARSPEGSAILRKLHFASQVIVQKQQMYLGAKTENLGYCRSGGALQLPRACAGCGCFATCTGHGGLISRYQTKPLQWDSQEPVVSKVASLWDSQEPVVSKVASLCTKPNLDAPLR